MGQKAIVSKTTREFMEHDTPRSGQVYVQEGIAVSGGYILENPHEPQIRDEQTQGVMGKIG